MKTYFFVAFFLIIAKCAAQEDLSQAEFLKEKLPGKWKEDQHKRKNLNNYLYEMGMYLTPDISFKSFFQPDLCTISIRIFLVFFQDSIGLNEST